jgi:hypothetical protein
MSYLRSNPLAEHNSGIALSSKDIPQNGGTGNMYQGQAGRAFVQGGGGMSQFHSFNPGANDADSVHARGSYAPVTVGINSVATCGGSSTRRKKNSKKSSAASAASRRRRRVTKCKKCKCDIIISGGGVRRHSRLCKHKCCKRTKTYGRRTFRQQGGGNGSFANAAYSIAGPGTGVGPSTIALANPAPYTAYNSCHPVV